ncbi:uncharacterized protein DUF4148 [Paraburkholderia eburnea]|uniref:Uncharacterized protein DUF4148 n=1 Tax=Paraburkholderia eburnea TaxID=1189126 RepID=A0A2S4LZQ4_9BURK|nr:DUF4148 domain-containing protein [Paraburkholderia eburnea]POR47943.1 uncharacterized protein DUF4148 [Paraburkholderia eburnea]PRZ19337.1 uncharacterized protein DUF4148 [Paraburkholderia eburnea]
MKARTLIQAAFVAALVAAPALSYAQSVDQNNAPKTRAEVRAELIQIEQAGYNPATANDSNYPSDIQAAEARVSQEQGQGVAQTQPNADTGYGGASTGSSQSGTQPETIAPSQRVYFGN